MLCQQATCHSYVYGLCLWSASLELPNEIRGYHATGGPVSSFTSCNPWVLVKVHTLLGFCSPGQKRGPSRTPWIHTRPVYTRPPVHEPNQPLRHAYQSLRIPSRPLQQRGDHQRTQKMGDSAQNDESLISPRDTWAINTGEHDAPSGSDLKGLRPVSRWMRPELSPRTNPGVTGGEQART